MRKVVYNKCFGGFGLSKKAMAWLKEHGWEHDEWYYRTEGRHAPELVACVEALGEDADGGYAQLAIKEVKGPYWVWEYDGTEEVYEPDTIPWVE